MPCKFSGRFCLVSGGEDNNFHDLTLLHDLIKVQKNSSGQSWIFNIVHEVVIGHSTFKTSVNIHFLEKAVIKTQSAGSHNIIMKLPMGL